jgi:ssDNA thymidine ADP-ribosyltransferase, DarT
MSKPDPLARITSLFHFTDCRNLPLIRELGGLYPLAQLREQNVQVPAIGGNQWSQEADGIRGMDQYVHLCFRGTHPMEFLARQDGRIVDSIFLEIHPDVLKFDGVKFTPDVSNKAGVDSYPIEEAAQMIDFEILYTRTNWSDPEIQKRLKQAEKCEILVPRYIPVKYIRLNT